MRKRDVRLEKKSIFSCKKYIRDSRISSHYIIRVISPHFVHPQFKRIATCSASNRVAAEVVNNIAVKFVTRRLSLKLNYRCPGYL